MDAPRSVHYAVVLRILQYVNGTLYHVLHYSSWSSLELHAYLDVDWVGDPTDWCSITGFYFLLGTFLISWHSKKQNVVSRSSTEAEYRALVVTTYEPVYLRWLLVDMDAPQPIATPLYCDNCSAIYITHNDVFHECTKHIEIDCHITRQHPRKAISSCSPSPLLTSMLISSPRLTCLVIFKILDPNANWLPSCHLEFEGGC